MENKSIWSFWDTAETLEIYYYYIIIFTTAPPYLISIILLLSFDWSNLVGSWILQKSGPSRQVFDLLWLIFSPIHLGHQRRSVASE